MIINQFNIMHQNIKNNKIKSIDAKLYNANYFDFLLHKGEVFTQDASVLNSMLLADFSELDINDGILYSSVSWSGATNSGVEMNDIGFTGMDNGLISFPKDRVTNEEFIDLLINSQYKIESGDTRLFLTPITGNTQMYNYPLYLTETDKEKYIACKGGFYQGFFKLYGHDYQVLPDILEDEWLLHFELRPRSDYEVTESLVNYTHKNNDGIFFFIGTRSENKFWPFYKTNNELMNKLKINDAMEDGYFSNSYDIEENNVVLLENKWVSKELEEDITYESYFAVGDDYFGGVLNENAYNKFKPSSTSVVTNEYFEDDYYDHRCPSFDNGKSISEEYIGEGVEVNLNGYDDSMGHAMSEHGYTEIVSDNKFLLFNRTSTGYTIDKWEEGAQIMLSSRREWPNANYFLLMDRTPTGYTIDTISSYNEQHRYDYSIYKDIRGNVFALRIREDGSIGYRYGVKSCENDEKYEVIEEYSKPNMVKKDEWNKINVRFSLIYPKEQKSNGENGRMKIYFYVNGFLIFVSKEVDALNLKKLDEVSQKQETVPYNISIGGGSLGLMETILPNYYAIPDYILPIERDFCGTFMGDIKSFKMYGNFIDYSLINDYLS